MVKLRNWDAIVRTCKYMFVNHNRSNMTQSAISKELDLLSMDNTKITEIFNFWLALCQPGACVDFDSCDKSC